MAKPTQESQIKRELRTPKYRSRVVEDKKKESKILPDSELEELEDAATCDHGFLAGCPYCK